MPILHFGQRADNRAIRSVAALLLFCACLLAAWPARAYAAADSAEQVLQSIARIDATVPGDARTAQSLGTQRQGSGIVIDDSGLVLTIGYLVLEAMSATVTDVDGAPVPADIVGYDYDTGFGLVRATKPLRRPALSLGTSADIVPGAPVLIANHDGRDGAIGGTVADVRTFAGYWEYLLDNAIFTAPPHPSWQGAALIGADGSLLGVGSLFVRDARQSPQPEPGNMFVPIDALKPILADLLTIGRGMASERPWLGIYSIEHQGYVVVTDVAPEGPAAAAGLRPGDIILKVDDLFVRSMPAFLRAVWAKGRPGVDVSLTVGRPSGIEEVTVTSGDRYRYLRLGSTY